MVLMRVILPMSRARAGSQTEPGAPSAFLYFREEYQSAILSAILTSTGFYFPSPSHPPKEAGAVAPVSLDELPDAASQDGADQDIRIEDDHFNWLALPRRRNCLNSATSCSWSTSARAFWQGGPRQP